MVEESEVAGENPNLSDEMATGSPVKVNRPASRSRVIENSLEREFDGNLYFSRKRALLIRVSDNGEAWAEDLNLAVKRHATAS